jgi:hypothetical protein
MAKSPFQNFNPEGLSKAVGQPIAGSPAVTSLLRRAAVACCGSSRISNEAIARIIEHVHRYDAPPVPRRVSFTDFYSDYPAYLEYDDISAAQYDAGRAILLLDETLDMISALGWGANVADRMMLAGAWIGDANEKFADDSRWRESIEATQQKLLHSRDVRPALNAKHAKGRETKAAALKFCKDQTTKPGKATAMTIAQEFGVKDKTVQNWMTEWRKAGEIK